MSKIRNIPEIRFKGFKDAWKQRKLAELFVNSGSGGTPKSTNKDFYDGDIPFLSIADIKGREISETAKMITQKGLQSSAAWLVPKGALSLAMYASVGKIGILNKSMATSQAFFNMVFDNEACRDFVYTRLEKAELFNEWESYISTGTQRNLNAEKVKRFKICVPESHETARIANIFSQIDNYITLHQRKYDQVVNLKKAMLEKMFPKNGSDTPEIRFKGYTGAWEERKFGDIGTVAMCKRIFKEETSESGDVPFYKIGTFGGEADAYITREMFEKYKTTYPYPQKGDILISASGSIGRTVEYTGKDEYFQDSNIVWLQHNKNIDNSFLKVLYSVVQWSCEGSTIKRLYNDNFLKTKILIPNKKEQSQIGEYFKNLDNLIALHQRKLQQLKKIKKAMLEKMFV